MQTGKQTFRHNDTNKFKQKGRHRYTDRQAQVSAVGQRD